MKTNNLAKPKRIKVRRTSTFIYSMCCAGIVMLLVLALVGVACADNRRGNKYWNKLAALPPMDPLQMELVMNLVVTCSDPITMGPSKDGLRSVWPIIGGKFEGPNISGTVIGSGADYPVGRRDGVWEIEALYRLLTDDGVTIIIHNYGIWIGGDKYRLTPEFWAPEGKYDWLNKGRFVCTLSDVPPGYGLANGPNENDRLLQVYRVY